MPSKDTYFKINENTPKNSFILSFLKEKGISLKTLAKEMNMHLTTLSLALNKKKISISAKLKIAKYFGKDTIEIFQ